MDHDLTDDEKKKKKTNKMENAQAKRKSYTDWVQNPLVVLVQMVTEKKEARRKDEADKKRVKILHFQKIHLHIYRCQRIHFMTFKKTSRQKKMIIANE